MLETITSDEKKRARIIAGFMSDAARHGKITFNDGQNISLEYPIVDVLSGEVIGKSYALLKVSEENKGVELHDGNSVLRNDHPTNVEFIEIEDGTTEYYHIMATDDGGHLLAEGINNEGFGDELIGSRRDVYLSLFPIKLGVYDNLDDLNKDIWKDEEVEFEGEKRKIKFGEKFAGFPPDGKHSMLVGKVKSFKKVKAAIGNDQYDFYIAEVDTAFGVLPMAVSEEKFAHLPKEGDTILFTGYVALDFLPCPKEAPKDSPKPAQKKKSFWDILKGIFS